MFDHYRIKISGIYPNIYKSQSYHQKQQYQQGDQKRNEYDQEEKTK